MRLAHRTSDARTIAAVPRMAVIADFVLTASAAVERPITGARLMVELGIPLNEGWITLSLILHGVAGAFWLPVVSR
jgi:uncharacterized membrane protein